MFATILFFVLAVVAVVAGAGMLISKNPVSSALWLVLNMLCIAGLYLTLNAQFIAVIQILVYAGAIMVLFLFVIMLLNLAEMPPLDQMNPLKVLGFVLGVGVLAMLLYVVAGYTGLMPEVVTAEAAAINGSAETIGVELFTKYAFLLQIIAILLLGATIGAVLLAKRRFV